MHYSYMYLTMAVFTWERITFWKTFQIAIQNVIGIVIWTTCVHMHCKRLPNHDQDLRTARKYFAPTAQSVLIDPCMASARISKMHTHISRSERALHSHVLESGFLCESRSKMPLFSCFKTRFKSLIWNSFAFTRAKIRLSNQERAESRSETSFGTWFFLMWTGPWFIWH